jgi:fumarate reductase subunit C
MSGTWWKDHPYYRFYMMREGTAVFAIWVSLLLICGMAFPDGIIRVLSNPLIILVNIAALAASLLHTKTWFDLAPKAVNLTEKQNAMLIKGLWGITIIASAIVLLVAFAR